MIYIIWYIYIKIYIIDILCIILLDIIIYYYILSLYTIIYHYLLLYIIIYYIIYIYYYDDLYYIVLILLFLLLLFLLLVFIIYYYILSYIYIYCMYIYIYYYTLLYIIIYIYIYTSIYIYIYTSYIFVIFSTYYQYKVMYIMYTIYYIAVCIWYIIYYRRKFRSQTSDNMERWKAEQGRGREKRKIRRKKSRRERARRQKMQMREKVGKSRNTAFFQWFVAPEGRKVGSLKRRVRSQLARWEMKICTPLWREAHFEVKMYKTHHSRTTFGSGDVEKVHAVVAFQMCFAPQRRALFRHRNFQKWSDHGVLCTFWLPNVLRATTACTFSTSQLPKVVRHWCVLYILTWKCASRHNGVHFFDISTSKSGPRPPVFNTFDFDMCFAPQRRAIFHRSCGQLAPHPPL